MTAPAARMRAAGGASAAAAGAGASAAVPNGVGSPSVAMFSLIVPGTPSSALSGAPRSPRASLARACARAGSGGRREVGCRGGPGGKKVGGLQMRLPTRDMRQHGLRDLDRRQLALAVGGHQGVGGQVVQVTHGG